MTTSPLSLSACYVSNENGLFYTGRVHPGVMWTANASEAFRYSEEGARRKITITPTFAGCHVFRDSGAERRGFSF